MNLQVIISDLKRERDRLDRAIAALDASAGTGRASAARHRPSTAETTVAGQGSRKRHLTPAGRKRLSELMKKRWAERRKQNASKSSAK